MNTAIWVSLGLTTLNLLLASFAGWAATTASRRLKQLRQALSAPSIKSLTQLDAEVAELTSAFSSLSTTVKRISSRGAIQERRERQSQGQLPSNFNQMSPAERKAVLRKKIASGEMTAIRDDGTIHEV